MPINPDDPDQSTPATDLYTVQEFRSGSWHDILTTPDEAAAHALKDVLGDNARVIEARSKAER